MYNGQVRRHNDHSFFRIPYGPLPNLKFGVFHLVLESINGCSCSHFTNLSISCGLDKKERMINWVVEYQFFPNFFIMLILALIIMLFFPFLFVSLISSVQLRGLKHGLESSSMSLLDSHTPFLYLSLLLTFHGLIISLGGKGCRHSWIWTGPRYIAGTGPSCPRKVSGSRTRTCIFTGSSGLVTL